MEQDKEFTMKDRFKRYLEREFRAIAPTQAAMDFRKQTLKDMLAHAQELRIKGITDEELIYDMVIDDLGDFRATLEDFQNRVVKTGETKRKISLGTAVALAIAAVLTLTYLIVGGVANVWHPTWLIMVGGVFAGVTVVLSIIGAKLVKKKKYIPFRAIVAVCIVLLSVFIFLLLQLVAKIDGSWLTFLAMVVVILGVDTAIGFATPNKFKWIELPIFVEVFCVMLYVILGIILDPLLHIASIWHPAWVLCLGGVLFAAVELLVIIGVRNKEKAVQESESLDKKYKKVDGSYWTEWDD